MHKAEKEGGCGEKSLLSQGTQKPLHFIKLCKLVFVSKLHLSAVQ